MRRLLLPILMLLAAPAAAQSNGWRELAKADADAALALIETNHPGAAPELGDTAFQALLAEARRHVAERLPRVDSFAAYSALMLGLANDFRDGHIWSNPTDINWQKRQWAGLVMVRRGGQWVVGGQQAAPGEPDLRDSRLTACDGEDADAWAKRRLGQFYANPAVEADLGRRAYMLLIDGNPFLPRVTACTFATREGTRTVTLAWRDIAQPDLQAQVIAAMHPGHAGFGVQPYGAGYRIALESLDERAEPVVAEVRAKLAELRKAPFVVLDMRGNGGGNSRYGGEIAALLMGKARADAAEPRGSQCNGVFWRTSPGNLKTLRLLAKRDTYWADAAADMERAIPEKRGFAPALPACAKSATVAHVTPARLPPSAMAGRMILLTDRACFSSCLIVTNRFRRLGALHVGEETNVSTRYMEVREIVLPSGLRTFSTLQKVAVGLGDFGPYTPERIFPGAMDDDAALQAWIAEQAAR